MQFDNPLALWFLLLIIPIVTAWIYTRKFRIFGQKFQIIGFPLSVGTLLVKILLLVAIVLLLAQPTTVHNELDPLQNGIDIMLVLDLSKSMLAEDVVPNRIQAGKKVLEDFIARRNNDRIGLIGFAGKPFILSPLTFDHDAISTIVDRTTVDTIKQEIPGLSGTAIGDALLLARSWLDTKISRTKVVILITDGEANLGIPPRDTIGVMAGDAIKIYSIGIWNPAGTELYTTSADWVRQYFTGSDGVPLRASIDESLLRELSETTGGIYQNAENSSSLEQTLRKIDTLERREMVGKTRAVVESYEIPLIVTILILLVVWVCLCQFDPSSSLRINLGRTDTLDHLSANFVHIKSMQFFQIGLLILWVIGSIWIFTSSRGWEDIGENLEIIIDVSRSMWVRDVTGITKESTDRINLTKTLAKNLVNKLPNRVGVSVSVFGWRKILIAPSTLDRESIIAKIESITTGISPGGSNLINVLGSSPSARYIFTDGGDIASGSVPPASSKPPVFVLIWSKSWGPIPLESWVFGERYLEENGKVIVSRADDTNIRTLSPKSEIQYIESYQDIWIRGMRKTMHLPRNISFISILLIIGLIIPTRKRISPQHA